MEESDRSEPTARHNTNNAAPCALSVYAQSGRAEQRDSAFPAAFPRQRRSVVSTSPRRWLMLRRCRNYSASEQFDEGFGLDSGREMCRSGVSPGYNWMEGKRGGDDGRTCSAQSRFAYRTDAKRRQLFTVAPPTSDHSRARRTERPRLRWGK